MTRIGINGFGRMGRLAFRAAWDCTDVEVVHINEIKGGAATAAYLLEFDSVHGRWPKSIKTEADGLTVEGRPITFTAEGSRTGSPGKPAMSISFWGAPENC